MSQGPLLDLALAIADGSPIDWSDSARSAGLCPEQLEQVRILQSLAEVHASGSPPGTRSATLDTTLHIWGPLRIIAPIGRGTFGDVYKACDPRLDRTVALKQIRDPQPDDAAAIEEARLLARIRHPNVVTVHGAERVNGRVGLWMEFLEGTTLEDEMRSRGAFPPDEVARVGITLASALAAVHRAGLLHRDIKAHNVMRDQDGRLVLTDFGAGREIHRNGITPELAGTPLYLAPEILDGGDASPASDVYSLGVLLYRLACGTFPVQADSLEELRNAHRFGGRRPLSSVRPRLPRPIAATIERALEPDPTRRIDLAGLETDLRDAIAIGRGRGVAALASLMIATIASVWFVAAGSRTVPRTGSTVSVEEVDATFQQRVNIRSPSSNPRMVTCTPWGHGSVAVCDLVAQSVREIRTPLSTRERSPQAFLSPDLERIAYLWSEGGQITLRVIRADGSADRELMRPAAGHSVSILQWTSSGAAVIVADNGPSDRRRVLSVPADGGTPTVLRTFGPEQGVIGSMQVSPDGRYLVFECRAPQDNGNRRVIIADLLAGSETALPGNWEDYGPTWTPDGRSIVFASDRFGTRGLFSIAVAAGKPAGEPRLVRDLGRSEIVPLGFSADGTLLVRAMVNWFDVFRAPIDLASATIGDLVRVDPRSIDQNVGPDWRSDDRQFAYLSGQIGYPRGKVRVEVHRRDGLIDRLWPIPSGVPNSARVRWSPDGRALAITWVEPGLDPRLQSINLLDPANGAFRPIASARDIWEMKWDPRGGGIYYGSEGSIRRVDLASGDSSVVYQTAGPGFADDLTTFDVSPDGTSIAFPAQTRSGRSVRILRLADHQVIDRYTFEHECRAVAFSHDGQRLLVSGSEEKTLQPSLFVMDLAGGEPRPLNVKTEYIVDFSLRHDDRELLLATGNPRPDVWMLRGVVR